MPGTLYIVSTPIGNLEDITQRAVRVLTEVDLIACEDTRHTRKLLNHYNINTPTTSYHDHNERERALELLTRLQQGASIAIVSDAGTPGISDPGFRIAKLAAENGITVVPVPGPTALIAALVASGFPSDQFFFGGFLPARSNQRKARFAEVVSIQATLIFYEAPHRITASLEDAREILGEREAVVARELTKLHEEIIRGTLSQLIARFAVSDVARGEMVLIIDRNVIATDEGLKDVSDVSKVVAELEQQGLDHRTAIKQAAKQLGLSRDETYRRLVAERSRNSDR